MTRNSTLLSMMAVALWLLLAGTAAGECMGPYQPEPGTGPNGPAPWAGTCTDTGAMDVEGFLLDAEDLLFGGQAATAAHQGPNNEGQPGWSQVNPGQGPQY
jgi:hypothetical protein